MQLEHILGDIDAEGLNSHHHSSSCHRLLTCACGRRSVHPISWKKKYGGMGTEQLKELKRLEKENERLRSAVSDLTLDKLILAEAAKGNF